MKTIIRTVPVRDINPAPYNPRLDLKPSDPEYKKLERSIDEFGLVEILVLNERTKNLVSGHQRLKILLAQGVTEIPVSVVDLPIEKEKQLNLILNKVRGDWDEDKLATLLDELSRIPDFDVTETGFDLPEISELLDSINQPPADDFDADAAAEAITDPVTKQGDVLRLGEHVVMCGDSANPADMKTLMGDDKADLYDSDFPYNVSYMQKNNRPSTDTRPKKSRQWQQIYGDDVPQAEYEAWMKRVMTNVKEYLRPGASIYIWQGHRQIPPLYQVLLDLDFHVSCLICWLKESATISFADFAFRSEHALYGWLKGATHYWAGSACESNVWEVRRDRTQNYQHPTQKPVELGAKAITFSSQRGGIVLDTFLGGAGLLLACETLGRKCRGMELDGRYVDVAVLRYAKLVGWDKVSPEIRERYFKEASK